MSPYYEDDRLATRVDAEREYVENVGRDNTDTCWILSDRDVWYQNPFFKGEITSHPEDDPEYYSGFDDE